MVLVIENFQLTIENVGVRMYLLLMGTFKFLAPILSIGSNSNGTLSSLSLVPFCTSYLSDPKNLPSPVESGEGRPSVRMPIPLSTTKVICQDSYETTVDLDISSSGIEEGDPVLPPALEVH